MAQILIFPPEDVLLSVAEIASHSNWNSILWKHFKFTMIVYVDWKRKIIEVEGNLLLN